MMMHMAYGVDMIALTAGTALLVWSMKNPGKGSWLGKLVGALVAIFSVISIICMFSCAMKGGDCHGFGYGEGMMMGSPSETATPVGEGHDRMNMNKKAEHKKS